MTTTSTPRDATPPTAAALIRPAYRAATIGILMVVTLIAFEAMAVATAMPTAVASLHGLAYYGWPFTGVPHRERRRQSWPAARSATADGPRRSLLAGLAVFTAGLVVAGLAPDMAVVRRSAARCRGWAAGWSSSRSTS